MDDFKILVNGKEYSVEPICNEDQCTRFRISNNCEYLFTVRTDEYGNWQMEEDVVPLDETLADEIGRAIEVHDAGNEI
jgi:hypothetical protein